MSSRRRLVCAATGGFIASVLVGAPPTIRAATSQADAIVVAFGHNNGGQLGDGTTSDRDSPSPVPGLGGVVSVAAGAEHSLALRVDGTVWAWGSNTNGQLGDGTNTSRTTPVQVAGLHGVTAIAVAAGGYHNLALASDGTVWAWGDNQCGQLGDGTTTDRNAPVQVLGLPGVKGIAAGKSLNGGHGLAVTSDGRVFAWGDNSSGQLGSGTVAPTGLLNRCLPNAIPGPALLPPGVTAESVAAGGSSNGGHSLALMDDGTVYAWGDNSAGQVGSPAVGIPSPIPTGVVGLTGKAVTGVAAGGRHSLARLQDGTLWAWGDNAQGQLGTELVAGTNAPPVSFAPAPVAGLHGVRAVAAGLDHSVAVSDDDTHPEGTVWAWGANSALGANYSNNYGQTGCRPGPQDRSMCAGSSVPVPVEDSSGAGGLLSGARAIAAGAYHTLVAKSEAIVPATTTSTTTPSTPACEVVPADAPQAGSGRPAGGAPVQSTEATTTSTVVPPLPGPTGSSSAQDDAWAQQQQTAARPDPRQLAVTALHPPTGQVVLFGGLSTLTNSVTDDTWAWDGPSSAWRKLIPPSGSPLEPARSPPARLGASIAYHACSGKLVLFGGVDGSGRLLADTWTWDGQTWTEEHPAAHPPPRWSAVMAELPSKGTVVLFGGSQVYPVDNVNGSPGPAKQSEAVFGDTWSWDGTNWSEDHPSVAPPPRRSATMAYHDNTGQDLLFGGTGPSANAMDDTWTWNGLTWTPRSSAQTLIFQPVVAGSGPVEVERHLGDGGGHRVGRWRPGARAISAEGTDSLSGGHVVAPGRIPPCPASGEYRKPT